MELAEEKNTKRKVSPSYIEVIVLSAFVSIGCLYVYDTYFAQKIAVFDLKEYKKQQGKLYLDGQYDEERHQRNLAEMNTFINRHSNFVFLDQDTVIANGKVIQVGKDRETGGDNE